MHAALSDRGANLAGLGISQCAPLGVSAEGRRVFLPRFGLLPGTSGNYFSTPRSAANAVIGDGAWLADVALNDWTPGDRQAVLARQDVSSQSCGVFHAAGASGELGFYFAYTGLSPAQQEKQSTVATGFADGSRHQILVTRSAATGTIKFYTTTDWGTWNQLGADLASTPGTIYDDASPWRVGGVLVGGTTYQPAGKVYLAQVFSGIPAFIGGSGSNTPVAEFNPNDWEGGKAWRSRKTEEIWTPNGSVSVGQALT